MSLGLMAFKLIIINRVRNSNDANLQIKLLVPLNLGLDVCVADLTDLT